MSIPSCRPGSRELPALRQSASAVERVPVRMAPRRDRRSNNHKDGAQFHEFVPPRVLRITWKVRGLPWASGTKIPARVSTELTGTMTTAAMALRSLESSFRAETLELAPIHPHAKKTANHDRIANFETS